MILVQGKDESAIEPGDHDTIHVKRSNGNGLLVCPENQEMIKLVSITSITQMLPLCKRTLHGKTWLNAYYEYSPYYTETKDPTRPKGIFTDLMNMLGHHFGIKMEFRYSLKSFFDKKTGKWTGGMGCVSNRNLVTV